MAPPAKHSPRKSRRSRNGVGAVRAPAPTPEQQQVDEVLDGVFDGILDPDPELEPQEVLGEAAQEGEAQTNDLAHGEHDTRGDAARLELQQRLGAYLTRGKPRVITTDNTHTMVTIKRGDGVVTFRLHHMFVLAPPAVLRALGRYAEKQDREAAKVLRAFIDTNEEQVRQREAPRAVTVDVQGKFHNLREIFEQINQRYFDGSLQAQITWGPRTKRKRSRDSIKLGSYTVEDELIRIHPVLDAADVPAYFVAWVVYHEMLHEVHDMPVVDGRRVYHTAEFRSAEAEFDRYAEAVMWERTHLHKLLNR